MQIPDKTLFLVYYRNATQNNCPGMCIIKFLLTCFFILFLHATLLAAGINNKTSHAVWHRGLFVSLPQKTVADTPRTLRFEDVAGNISKAEFEKKALQKTNQLNIYLKVICDRSADYEEINKAIDQSMGLFVDENAMIETSSVNRNDVKRYKVRNYLSHIKLIKYDKIEIEWTNVQYVSDLKQGPDGNYYGVVSFEQVFRGYRDGKLIYEDVTRKNTNVVLKTYEKNIDGNTKSLWDVLLSDIGVISTKSL